MNIDTAAYSKEDLVSSLVTLLCLFDEARGWGKFSEVPLIHELASAFPDNHLVMGLLPEIWQGGDYDADQWREVKRRIFGG